MSNDKAARKIVVPVTSKVLRLTCRVYEVQSTPSVALTDEHGWRYQPGVLDGASLHFSLMNQALRELEAFEARYRHDLDEVCGLVRVAREKLRWSDFWEGRRFGAMRTRCSEHSLEASIVSATCPTKKEELP